MIRRPAAALALVLALVAARASAQDALADGHAQYADADFEGAIATLRGALAGDGLTREQVGDALATIAEASLALGNYEDVRAALGQLAVVDHDHVLGDEMPPEIRDTFTVLRETAEPVHVHLAVTPRVADHEVAASVDPTADGVVREVTLSCEGDHGPGLASGNAPSLVVVGHAHCTVEVHGLGGLSLARAESEVGTVEAPPPRPRRHGEFPWLWVGIGAGVVVAAVVVIAIAVAASSGSDQTHIVPMVMF